MTILGKSSPRCPEVNVGSDEAVLIGDLAKKVADCFGVKASAPELTGFVTDRYVPSIEKALAMGCPKPLSLNDALNKTIQAITLYNHQNEYNNKQLD